MIIGHHFALHGRFNYFQYNAQLVDVEKVLVIFQAFGKIGVDIFVLIGACQPCVPKFSDQQLRLL